ncbi:MAG: hypothetical protein GY711_33080 [bacterium]|nr:hypothetical protein [bacterium]
MQIALEVNGEPADAPLDWWLDVRARSVAGDPVEVEHRFRDVDHGAAQRVELHLAALDQVLVEFPPYAGHPVAARRVRADGIARRIDVSFGANPTERK